MTLRPWGCGDAGKVYPYTDGPPIFATYTRQDVTSGKRMGLLFQGEIWFQITPRFISHYVQISVKVLELVLLLSSQHITVIHQCVGWRWSALNVALSIIAGIHLSTKCKRCAHFAQCKASWVNTSIKHAGGSSFPPRSLLYYPWSTWTLKACVVVIFPQHESTQVNVSLCSYI